MALIYSVLDEKGEAVRGAKELVELAGLQGPMVRFPQLMAYEGKEQKGKLHEGIASDKIVAASNDPRYNGPCVAFLPDMWEHVVALLKMPPATRLRDAHPLRPLFELLAPLAKHSLISNFEAEELMKVSGKVLKPQQRLNEKK